MPPVTVYSGPFCPYCMRAKQLLKRKGVDFIEIDVRADDTAMAEMLSRSNGRQTIPQIFIGERHVGGCDDLYAIDKTGELDRLLQAGG